jgi:hypothetical protein
MAVYVCGGFAGIAFCFDFRVELSLMNLTFENNGKTGLINVGTGTIPGVLFLVTRLWSLAVFFSALFVVGFCDCMIFGASVICGIVTMGVLLITLCSSLRTACVRASCILCSSMLRGGAKSFLIPCSSCWSNRRHFGVTGMPMAVLFNSFVSSCRPAGVGTASYLVVGNVGGTILLILISRKLSFQVCSINHTCNGLVTALGTMHPPLLMPRQDPHVSPSS